MWLTIILTIIGFIIISLILFSDKLRSRTLKYPTRNQLIGLLEKIPDDDFIKFAITDEVSRCCAVGHLVRLKSKDPNDYSFKNCSLHINIGVTGTLKDKEKNLGLTYEQLIELAKANNGNRCLGNTPKERSINYLRSL